MIKYIIAIIGLFFTLQTYAISESDTATYKKWAIQEPNIFEFYFGKKDCIGTSTDFGGTGDLMSTLIVDNSFRNKIIEKQYTADYKTSLNDINLLVDYTPEYLMSLDKIISKKLQKNFYARYICNIGKNIDIITGDYSSQGRFSKVLLLRKNNTIYILPKSIKLYNNSATGADAHHCSATVKNNTTLEWSCFMWLPDNSKTYTISLKTGKILKVHQ